MPSGVLGRIAVLALALAIGLATGPQAFAQDTEAQVGNVAPVVLSQSLPSTSLTPTAGGTTDTTVTVVVEDLNGCADIASADYQVNASDGSVHIASQSLLPYDSCATGTDATFTATFSMNYYDDPATDLSTDSYKIYVTACDTQGECTNNAVDLSLLAFTYAELVALNLNVSTLDFGTNLDPETTSSVGYLGVENYGNVQIDVQLSGTNLSHATESAWIDVTYLNYSQAADMTGKASLTSSAVTLSTFDLAYGSGSSDTLHWQLSVPSGKHQWIPSGDYTGSLTVSGVSG